MIDNKMNQIADKIQKLLNLAGNNPSEAEAQAALLKAQALMAKYNIDKESLSAEEAISYDLIQTKVKSHKFNNQLGQILGNSFACRVIIFDSKVSFFGRSDNAKAAASAMEFAFKVMKKGGDKATRDNGYTPGREGAAHFYNSYVLGFLDGLKTTLDAQTVALAIVVPKDVHDEFNKKFPRTRPVKSTGTKAAFGRAAYEAGKRDGSSVMGKRSLNA